MEFTRRNALRSLFAIGATFVGTRNRKAEARTIPATQDKPQVVDDPRLSPPSIQGTEDMYRAEFAATFGEASDHGYAFHCVNCQGNCAWTVWAKDGKVTRESQSANYPAIAPDIPDSNPRGCNKGAQHSQIMYNEDRLKFPLRRTGPRGSGQWERISWETAIDEVAQNLYNTMITTGPEGNYIHVGAGMLSEARGAAFKRLGTLLGAVRPYIASYVGDMFPGTSVVYGEGNIGCSYDFMFKTNVQVYWGCNPNQTRIPDAHYIWEGKYNGSKVIVISPEFNATAIHADLWVPIKPGYDGHLAMSIMHEMVAHELFNKERAKTFTDLPFLVRDDNGKMLRLSDIDAKWDGFDHALHHDLNHLAHDGEETAEEVFLCWDASTKKVTALPGCRGSALKTLRLEDRGFKIDPALSASQKVKLADGSMVGVHTVFDDLKKELEKFRPEDTQAVTGVHPEVVSILARDIALPEVVSVTIGFSLGKHFNGMLTQRAIGSMVALTGRMGPEGGMNTENEWSISGLGGLSGFSGKYKQRFASGSISEFMLGDGMKDAEKLYSDDDMKSATGMDFATYKAAVEKELAPAKNDDGVGKGKSYWETVETFLIAADARFRRNKGGYRDAFLRKAKFFAYVDFRMSDMATWADILLPARSHYEVYDLRTNPGYHRFANISQPPKGLKHVGEAKSEWDIATMIIERLQQIALAKFEETGKKEHIHIPDTTHSQTGARELDIVAEVFTDHGHLGTDKQAVEYALANVPQFAGETLKSTTGRGGFLTVNEKGGKSSPLYPNEPYHTLENHLALLEPFETLSGRMTFYVDHPIWIQAGAAIATASKPLSPNRFPLLLMTPHARWSIHSTYKTSATLLRLQRGEPYVMISPKDADKRGIRDGDSIIMFNDLAETKLMAKITPIVPEGAVVMEHGWEPFMFENKTSHNALAGDMLNLLEVTDGWGHLKFGVHWDGNQHAYAGNVDLKGA
jgi:DMSO reductase family type II enzyme molybdopterin subunit